MSYMHMITILHYPGLEFSTPTPWGIASLFLLGQRMDTSRPAILVNGKILPLHMRKRVRTVIQVVRPDRVGIIGKSTDDLEITVKGTPPASLTTFVEVIGVADGEKSIQAEVWTNFGDTFDAHSYNQLCQLANGEYQHLFL